MPSVMAKRNCPNLIFVNPRFDAYKAVSLQMPDRAGNEFWCWMLSRRAVAELPPRIPAWFCDPHCCSITPSRAAAAANPVETTRGLPGGADDTHSRYIEAAVNGVLVASMYLPNGNPAPGPKFDYKLRWFDRLIAHAAELLALDKPVVLARRQRHALPTWMSMRQSVGAMTPYSVRKSGPPSIV
jgi:hypothetical protein